MPVDLGYNPSAVGAYTYTSPGNAPLRNVERPVSFETRQDKLSELLQYGTQAAAVGFLDTVGQSVGILDDDESTVKMLEDATPRFAEWYLENQEGAQAAGDLAGMFVPGIAFTKLLRTGKYASTGLKALGKFTDESPTGKVIDAIFDTGKLRKASFEAFRKRNQQLLNDKQVDFTLDESYRKLMRQSKGFAIGDQMRNDVAFELGVYTAMNDSQTLYPDEISAGETFAWNAAFLTPGVAFSWWNSARVLRGITQQFSPQVKEAVFDGFSAFNDIMSEPGNRWASVTSHSMLADASEVAFASARTQNEQGNVKQAISSFRGLRRDDIENIAKDKLEAFGDITKSTTLSPGQVEGVEKLLDGDNAALVGVISLQNDFKEGAKEYHATVASLLTKKRAEMDSIEKGIDAFAQVDGAGMADQSLLDRADNLAREIDDISKTQYFVSESTGELVDGNARRALWHDRVGVANDITFTSGTKKEAGIYTASLNEPGNVWGGQVKIGVDQNFNVLIDRPPRPKVGVRETVTVTEVPEIVDATDYTAVIPFQDIDQVETASSKLLQDMTQDWHVRDGRFGQEVMDTLSAEIRREVNKWAGGPNTSKLREWQKNDTHQWRELKEAFRSSGMRSRLQELADDDGTIKLWRGEDSAETVAPTNDLVSFTTSPITAKAFAERAGRGSGNIIEKNVHIDDIILVSGHSPFEDTSVEFEFVVQGNLSRKDSPSVVAASQRTEHIEKTDIIEEWKAATSGSIRWEELDTLHASMGYALAERAITNHKLGNITNGITRSSNHVEFDIWLEGFRRYGDSWMTDAPMPKAWTVDFLTEKMIHLKYREWFKRRKARDAARDPSAIKLPDEKIASDLDIDRALNMPIPKRGEPSALAEFFQTHYVQGDNNIDMFAMSTIRENMRRTTEVRLKTATDSTLPANDIIGDQAVENFDRLYDMPITGTMLSRKPGIPPVAVLKKGDELNRLNSRQRLSQAITIQREEVFRKLGNADKFDAPMIQVVMDVVRKNQPAFMSSKKVSSIQQGGQAGTGFLSTQSKSFGEGEAFGSGYNLGGAMEKAFNQQLGKGYDLEIYGFGELKRSYNQALHLLRSNKHASSNALLSTALHAKREGWELQEIPFQVDLDDGTTGIQFGLRDTENNRMMLKQRFPDVENWDFEEGFIAMPSPAGSVYAPVTMDELAFTGYEAISDMNRQLFDSHQHLRYVDGAPERVWQEWSVPVKNFATGTNVYLYNKSGVHVQTVNGRSQNSAMAEARKEIALYKKNRGEDLTPHTERDLEATDYGLEDAWYSTANTTDPGTDFAAMGSKQAGARVETGEGVIIDIVEGHGRAWESVLRRTRSKLYEPELNYAKKMIDMGGNKAAEDRGTLAWQQYMRMLTGDSGLNPNSYTGKIYNVINDVYDDYVAAAWDEVTGQVSNVNPWARSQSEVFKNIKGKVGEHSPFVDAMQFAETTHNIQTPSNLRQHAQIMNRFTSLLTLRLFETGHSVLTLTSLMATMPAVITALKKTDIEQAEGAIGSATHATRIGAYGYMVDSETPMFSGVRAISSGIHFMFSKEGREVWKAAARDGYLDQSVSEVMRVLTAPREGFVGNFLTNNTAVRLSTMLSDKSEILARGISYSTGYNIAKRGLHLGDDAARLFAHKFANDVIGDYNPRNKPQIFQGAAGLPLSLFMTFMQNYYQRLFGYAENAQTRAMIVQYATQASVFGAQTVPGFKQFTDFFGQNYDGSVNPIDGFENKFGKEFTEWVMYGSLANLPKMFGSEDGISIYTRGDVSFRNVPTIFSLADSANYATIKSGFDILSNLVTSFRESEGFNVRQMTEILGNYTTNRTLRGTAELLGGVAVDRGGLVRNTDTRETMSAIARVLGMRTLSETRKMEKMRRMQSTLRSQAYRMKDLRRTVRADIRSGNYADREEAPELMARTLQNYVKYGGSPEYFARFLGEQMSAATLDKAQTEFLSTLTDSTRGYDIMRMMPLMQDDIDQGNFLTPFQQ